MAHKLFCYGTLCIPGIMRQVCGRQPVAQSARLTGYAAVTLTDRVYPGLLPDPAAEADGIIYSGLSRAQLSRLDAYEGEEYRRCLVRVCTAAGHPQRVWTYLLQPRYHYLATRRGWSLEHFIRDELALYLHSHHNKLAGQHGRNPNQST
jgi:gamma-glutamylcyclotransferase (GGCT)/AIG2-like uncharacterized protein YtfP